MFNLISFDCESTIKEKCGAQYAYEIAWVVYRSNGEVIAKRDFIVKQVQKDFNNSNAIGENKFFAYNQAGIYEVASLQMIERSFRTDWIIYKPHIIHTHNIGADRKIMFDTFTQYGILHDRIDVFLNYDSMQLVQMLLQPLSSSAKERLKLRDLPETDLQKEYYSFCKRHNLLDKRGLCPKNLENALQFVLQNPDYKQSHFALQDAIDARFLQLWLQQKLRYNMD